MKKRLSEQLPVHTPDPGTWQRLSAQLDALAAETAYHEKLDQLPLHSPNQGTWNSIHRRLSRIHYIKTASRIALAAAAGLLLFFSISRFTDHSLKAPPIPGIAQQQQAVHQPVDLTPALRPSGITPTRSAASQKAVKRRPAFNSASVPSSNVVASQPSISELASAEEPVGIFPDHEITRENENAVPVLGATALTPQITIPLALTTIPAKTLGRKTGVQAAWAENRSGSSVPPTVKYYTPKETKPGSNTSHFALAMNYLPENINNGTTNSLFHNVDVTASYNKEKVRFNTSLGLAYNEEQLNFNMNYNIKSPVTAVGPGGHLDTLGYNLATMESQYQGTEKHEYFTYNLGIGRRLFSLGKFSTWINAGAGFGIRMNNPDLISSTEKSIKGQYNALINSIVTSNPVYNNVNVNFVTGIDFNYKILNRISITFTPTSRWYFKPVLLKDNQATDELTLGFKSGIKVDF